MREKEQKMFDKKLFNVKKLKRLKSFKQAIALKRIILIATCLDDLLTLFSFDLNWLNSLVFEILATFVDNSQDSWLILMYSLMWDIFFISQSIVDFFFVKFARFHIFDSFVINNEKLFVLTCSSMLISIQIYETQKIFWRWQKNLIYNWFVPWRFWWKTIRF